MTEFLLKAVGILGLSGVTLAAIVTLVWQVFKRLGASWLDAKFAERLEDYKHRQNQEIERLRGEVAQLLDRAAKLHQAEFEILPQVWEKLNVCFGSVGSNISAIKSYSNVQWLTEAELEKALKEPFLRDFERDKIRAETGQSRQKLFQQTMDEHLYREAHKRWVELNNFVVTKGIFIHPDLRAAVKDLITRLRDVLEDYRFERFDSETLPKKYGDVRTQFDEAAALRDETLASVSTRLWDSLKPTAA